MPKDKNAGFPEDGEEYHDEEGEETEKNKKPEAGEGGEDGEGGEEETKKPQGESIEERLARLEGENAALRAIATRPPPEKTTKKEPEPEPDWEKLMYDDPKEYTKQLRNAVKKEVELDLGNKYQKDQGEKEFWGEFYDEHKDLREDKDLVRAVLGNNLNILGDLPVSQAKKKLADLTRERIMKYTGKREKDDKGEKARVEGARSPKAPDKKVEENKVVTLSDIIRNRRANRMKAKTA